MNDHRTAVLDALTNVKLLPRRAAEADVVYGYVDQREAPMIVWAILAWLRQHRYEVHCCEWIGETVLLALNGTPEPTAIRLTTSPAERYTLYTLSRPATAQALWQWAQGARLQQVRRDR
jgi:hypothetical protein